VVDAYVAITDDRVYRKARNHEQAVQELLKYSGSQFDPRVVEALLKVTGDGTSNAAA
jgi:HD-GYP domain-containing protein (c-di-GMP phosphodiesterase class II)